MKKVTRLILMLCFILSGAFCFAYGVEGTKEKGDGIIIDILEVTSNAGINRSNSIIATLNGHLLTVVFSENMGQVSVEVATSSGATVDCLSVLTPNGVQVYIPNAGNYIVTFTLSNGDVYYGEFTVID